MVIHDKIVSTGDWWNCDIAFQRDLNRFEDETAVGFLEGPDQHLAILSQTNVKGALATDVFHFPLRQNSVLGDLVLDSVLWKPQLAYKVVSPTIDIIILVYEKRMIIPSHNLNIVCIIRNLY